MDRRAGPPSARQSATSGQSLSAGQSVASGQSVAGVMLLGVRVTAHAVLNLAEHDRRTAAGVGAVIDPALLDRLLELPAGVAVPAGWAGQWPGILECDPDGVTVTRRLESPLSITDVVIQAAAGRELPAVQDASLFAGFTRRWVAAGRVPDAVLLEAKLCGVGILAAGAQVVLPAAEPAALTRDGWSWLLEEKVYRRWLGERARARAEVQPLAEPA